MGERQCTDLPCVIVPGGRQTGVQTHETVIVSF